MLTDFRGVEIKVGSAIVYSVKSSTSCYVREGVVTEVFEGAPGQVHHAGCGDLISRGVPHINVAPTGRSSSKWRNGTKPVRLTNLSNVVVLA